MKLKPDPLKMLLADCRAELIDMRKIRATADGKEYKPPIAYVLNMLDRIEKAYRRERKAWQADADEALKFAKVCVSQKLEDSLNDIMFAVWDIQDYLNPTNNKSKGGKK